jgi:hypothetical protein
MAQFMAVALKATIVVTKKRLAMDKIPAEVAIETVSENFDLSLYDYSETEHFHLWKLKNELLTVEIVPFLESVFKFYYDKEEGSYQSVIGEVKRRKEYDNIFKLAKEAEYEHFELNNKQNQQFHLKKYGKHVQVDFNYFQLFKSERLRMDNFDKLMQFLENCMQKAFSEFQLSKALEIFIYDTKIQ